MLEENVPVEIEINNYLSSKYSYSEQDLKELNLPTKMNLVYFKDKKKWEYFKLKLRKKGYII